MTPPGLDGDPLPLPGLQVETPQLLTDVAAPHDAPVHVQPALVHHGRVTGTLARGAGADAADLKIGRSCFLYLRANYRVNFLTGAPLKITSFLSPQKNSVFFSELKKNRVPRVPKKTLFFFRAEKKTESPESPKKLCFFLGGAPPQNHKFHLGTLFLLELVILRGAPVEDSIFFWNL